MTAQRWNVSSARSYEDYLVPAFFGPFAQRLVDRVAPQRGERVLDVACGTGAVARHAAARGALTTGIDRNPDMLDVARSVCGDVTWQVADAAAPAGPDDEHYDVVLCQQGLQFLPDHAAAIAAWRAVLRPGGRIGVSVWRSIAHQPGYLALAEALDRAVGTDIGDIMRAPFAGPGRDDLRSLLENARLHPVSVVIDVGVVRFPSAETFLHRQVAASPLSEPVAALPTERVAALATEVTSAMAPFTDDEGVVFPIEAVVATGVV
ncbi:class I SAM-dependent methyltransferase [Pseudonocardia sp.]|uniref:class I SAM-dependent methyltransferase n=1 Tax=Pseudonocardia sp. TaxID=60912 RepID=UPI003D0B94BD